ncbi:MAG: rod shape-determining protein RodA [Treponema sp.]|jgi:rod shape determining protein RodA|nr:rod shape-determining protein RodA [Treponema sp.]
MKIRDFLEIDFFLLFASIALTVFGILFIYSSGVTSTGVLVSNEYIRQIIWGIAGFVIALVLSQVNYGRIRGLSVYLYLGNLALILYTIFFGREVNGARSWVGIGSFGIQPSEFAKITTILLLARYLADSDRSGNSFLRFAISCLIVFVPMGLILMQPDFGTSLVFIPILLVMTFIAGIALRYIIFMIALIGITGILMVLPLWQSFILRENIPFLNFLSNARFTAITALGLTVIAFIALYGYIKYKKKYFYWILYSAAIAVLSLGASFLSHKVLKEYQIKRLIVFLDPEVDPRGAGWNIIQSVIAIGSGGLSGKGYLQGTQSHYRFLPQQSTDFIFSIFTEEAGFLGGLVVFALFLIMVLRLIKIIKITNDPFGAYISAGLAGMFVFHFLINVGMTMGIMPITGIPLLFMSYGGSAIISAMTGIGLAMSVHVRRFHH